MVTNPSVGVEANLARHHHPRAQALPGAQQTGLGGGQGQVVLIGELSQRVTGEIAGAQDIGVIGGKLVEDTDETLAQRIDRIAMVGIGLSNLQTVIADTGVGFGCAVPINKRVPGHLK